MWLIFHWTALYYMNETYSCVTNETMISQFIHINDEIDKWSYFSPLSHTFHFWYKDPELFKVGELGLACRVLLGNTSV